MRTTLTLDADLARRLRDLAHRDGQTFKQTVNDVVRRGLGAQAHIPPAEPYTIEVHPGGFRPGIDPGKLNQLVDEFDAEDVTEQAGR